MTDEMGDHSFTVWVVHEHDQNENDKVEFGFKGILYSFQGFSRAYSEFNFVKRCCPHVAVCCGLEGCCLVLL